MGKGHDAVERRAEFMAHVGQKFGFQTVRLLHLETLGLQFRGLYPQFIRLGLEFLGLGLEFVIEGRELFVGLVHFLRSLLQFLVSRFGLLKKGFDPGALGRGVKGYGKNLSGQVQQFPFEWGQRLERRHFHDSQEIFFVEKGECIDAFRGLTYGPRGAHRFFSGDVAKEDRFFLHRHLAHDPFSVLETGGKTVSLRQGKGRLQFTGTLLPVLGVKGAAAGPHMPRNKADAFFTQFVKGKLSRQLPVQGILAVPEPELALEPVDQFVEVGGHFRDFVLSRDF